MMKNIGIMLHLFKKNKDKIGFRDIIIISYPSYRPDYYIKN